LFKGVDASDWVIFFVKDHLAVSIEHLVQSLLLFHGKPSIRLHPGESIPDPVQIVLQDVRFAPGQRSRSDPLVDSVLLVSDPIMEISVCCSSNDADS
jgi:hypothetical protein